MDPIGSLDGKPLIASLRSDADERVKFENNLSVKGMIPDKIIQNWKGPVDKITLSVEAKKILKDGFFEDGAKNNNIISKNEITVAQIKYDDIPIDPSSSEDEKMANSKYRDGIRDLLEKKSDFGRKTVDLVKNSLDIPDNFGFSVQGAATAVVNEIAKRNGIDKPQPSQFLIDSGWKDIFAESNASETGSITLNIPNSEKALTIAFDRSSTISPDHLSLIALGSQNNQNAALSKKIENSPLGGFKNLGREANATHYAVTDGEKGQNARVFASIQSMGMDEFASSSSLNLIKKLMAYFPEKSTGANSN
jgi:hypothetical protein